MGRLLTHLLGRILIVFLLTTLCSFLALDKPVLRNLYLAVGSFLNFLVHFVELSAPFLGVVWDAYWRSAILLASALAAGLLVGVPLGVLTATRPRSPIGRLAGMLSYAGTLAPSFLLGLLIMVFFVRLLGYWTGLQWIRIMPSPGIPEPREILAPALTLAARPVAYIARVTSAHVAEQLRLAYVRTAQSKGLTNRRVLIGHIGPNVAVPVLGAARSSILFSLSSLPIVEYIFGWNGVGYVLLQAVLTQRTVLAALLITALGATFVVVATAVEVISLRLDPRLRPAGDEG